MSDEKIGPTGKFPDGKLGEEDCGEINVGIDVRDGRVVVTFGAPIYLLWMSPEEAISFGEAIIRVGRKAISERLS
jgi:hypothetical protein